MKSSILVVAKCDDSDTRLWNSLIDIKSKPQKIVKYSMGTFIKIDDIPYVLSCYHGIQYFYDIYIYQFIKVDKNQYGVKKIEVSLECFSDELDLALLTISEEIDNVEFLDVNKFLTRVPNENENINIKYDKTKKISKDFLSKETKNIQLVMKELIFEKYNSFNMPEMPYLKCIIKNLSNDKLVTLKGLSGNLCYDSKNRVVGMLTNYDRKENFIKIIPSLVIQNFLNEYKSSHKYDGISSIMFTDSICEFEHNGRDHIGIIINDLYGIRYQEGLKSEDIIYRINDKEITKNGSIFDPKLERYVPYKTFIPMNLNDNDMIKLDIMRNDTKLKDYRDIVVNVKPIPIQTIRNIPINHNNRYCTVRGFVFTELSENIIEFYRNHNIKIVGDVMDKYAHKPYRPYGPHGPLSKSGIIVLVNIVNSDFNELDLKTIYDTGLPLLKKKHTRNEFYLCILEKINKKNIKSLYDINRYFTDDVDTMKFSVDKNIKLRINSAKTNLSITYIVK